MTSALRHPQPMTIAEFDDFLEQPGNENGDYELIDGDIVAVDGNTIRHARLASNIGAPLTVAMWGRGYQAYQRGIGLQRNSDLQAFDKVRPDVLVCSKSTDANDGLLTYVDGAIVVVEVLSPSSMGVDRGRKLIFYKSLDTLQHIVIVYQDEMRIEHSRRSADGWLTNVLTRPEDTLDLSAVAFKITAAEVYSGVTL